MVIASRADRTGQTMQNNNILGMFGGYKNDLTVLFTESRVKMHYRVAKEIYGNATNTIIEHLSDTNTRDIKSNVYNKASIPPKVREALDRLLNKYKKDIENGELSSKSQSPIFSMIKQIERDSSNLEDKLKELSDTLKERGRDPKDVDDMIESIRGNDLVEGSKAHKAFKFQQAISNKLSIDLDMKERLEFEATPTKQKINVVKKWVKELPKDQIEAYANPKKDSNLSDSEMIERASIKYLSNFDDVLNQEVDGLIQEIGYMSGIDKGKKIQLKKALRLHVIKLGVTNKDSISESLASAGINYEGLSKLSKETQMIRQLEEEGNFRSASQLIFQLQKKADVIFKDNPEASELLKSNTAAQLFGGLKTFTNTLAVSASNIVRADLTHITTHITKSLLEAKTVEEAVDRTKTLGFILKRGATASLFKNIFERPFKMYKDGVSLSERKDIFLDNISAPALASGFQDVETNNVDASRRQFFISLENLKQAKQEGSYLKTYYPCVICFS